MPPGLSRHIWRFWNGGLQDRRDLQGCVCVTIQIVSVNKKCFLRLPFSSVRWCLSIWSCSLWDAHRTREIRRRADSFSQLRSCSRTLIGFRLCSWFIFEALFTDLSCTVMENSFQAFEQTDGQISVSIWQILWCSYGVLIYFKVFLCFFSDLGLWTGWF